MIQHISLISVYVGDLSAKQISIICVRLLVDIKFNQCGIMYGYHVIKAKETQLATIKFQNMMTVLDVGMIGLWRLHRNKIAEISNVKDNSNIGPTAVLVILDTAVSAFEKTNVLIFNSVYS